MKGTILIIDDEDLMHHYINIALTNAGYKMISAYNGPDGLEMIQKYNPDVVLLDYMMPEMDGYEVYEQIVKDESLSSIPVVILTALNEIPSKKDDLFKKGLSAYLEKPFGHKELINVIENIIVTKKIQIHNQQLHKAIKDTKDFLENLISSSPDAIITLDIHGVITSFSTGAEKILGYSSDSVVGNSLLSYISENNGFDQKWRVLVQNRSIKNMEMEFLSSENIYIPINFSFSLLQDNNEEIIGVLAIGKDLSELKEMERKLIEKEKLAVLMETTVAINHEINNPLTPILGNVQIILDKKEELPSWVVKKLEIIEKNAWRIQQIVQKLNEITQPTNKVYCGETNMLDINSS